MGSIYALGWSIAPLVVSDLLKEEENTLLNVNHTHMKMSLKPNYVGFNLIVCACVCPSFESFVGPTRCINL